MTISNGSLFLPQDKKKKKNSEFVFGNSENVTINFFTLLWGGGGGGA